MKSIHSFMVLIFGIGLVAQSLSAGILREHLKEDDAEKEAIVHQNIRLVSNVPYGKNSKERFDVYMPSHAVQNAPIIFMVHGGAWMIGDKKNQSVVENKVNYWVEQKGYIVVSMNYPMLPSTPVNEQLMEVAKALGAMQAQCTSWGGDKNRVIVMGHSAGAHLIALLASSSSLYANNGITQPIAAVFLDSAVMDTPTLMHAKHLRLYDRAFGNEPNYWQSLSPYHQLSTKRMPFLAVCSTKRDDSCPQAKSFLEKASGLGTQTLLIPMDLSHQDINMLLGKQEAYTTLVDDFLTHALIH